MIPVKKCSVCGGARLEPYSMSPYNGKMLHFSQARCADCGVLIAQPQASEDEIAEYYGRTFYEHQWPDPEKVWEPNTAAYKEYEIPMMERLWAAWPPPAGARAAEVGCGYGIMSHLLREKGFQVQSCEMGARAVAYCKSRGLDVVEGRFPGIPLQKGSFDLSLSLQVIEHVSDPLAFVREMVELVRPGGAVVITTEDAKISQYAWERFTARIRGKLPRFRSSTDHTFVFCAEHLKSMMEASGCEDVKTLSYSSKPEKESLHWKLYKGTFRLVDRLTGHGEWLMAVGRRKMLQG